MSEPQRIVITGAAGRFGRFVVERLHRDHPDLLATDQREIDGFGGRFRRCDLLDPAAVGALLRGADTVIHLGNHPGLKHPQTTFNENVAMNMNVFQAAAEEGLGRIVFASTLQQIGSHSDGRTVRRPPPPPAYPLSEKTEPRPANTYALSKTVSEVVLRYFAERCGLSTVAIRFPIIDAGSIKVALTEERLDANAIREGFSCISARDGAELIAAILHTDLPGFRVYAPGTAGRVRDAGLADLIRRHLPGVPPDLPDLVDNATITRETGWAPRDFLN